MTQDKHLVSSIIKDHDLKPGDKMLNINGDEIENSVVLGSYSCAYRDDNQVVIEKEKIIGGGRELLRLSADEWDALRSASI